MSDGGNIFDTSATRELLSSRAQRLSQPRISGSELKQTSFLYFECAQKKYAIASKFSCGVIANASLYCVPGLQASGVSLINYHGQQLLVFNLEKSQKEVNAVAEKVLIIGRGRPEFGLSVFGSVRQESISEQSLRDCHFDSQNPLMGSVFAASDDGRLIIDDEILFKSEHFDFSKI